MNERIIPLFPQMMYVDVLEADLSPLNSIKSYPFERTNTSGSMVTKDFYILDKFPSIRIEILKSVDKFVKEVFHSDAQFKMTTSWATKCGKGQGSDFHNHKNCMYSAVLYLEDVTSGGELVISSEGLSSSSFMFKQSDNPTAFNGDAFFIQPEKNTLVLFPSHLLHKVNPYTGYGYRYSIAMNFIPVARMGEKDSEIR